MDEESRTPLMYKECSPVEELKTEQTWYHVFGSIEVDVLLTSLVAPFMSRNILLFVSRRAYLRVVPRLPPFAMIPLAEVEEAD